MLISPLTDLLNYETLCKICRRECIPLAFAECCNFQGQKNDSLWIEIDACGGVHMMQLDKVSQKVAMRRHKNDGDERRSGKENT